MIPLRDTIRAREFPLVNTLLIGMNLIAFILELRLGPRADRLVMNLGFIPAYFLEYQDYHAYATLLTSMFLHAGWFHLFSNMLALYIFGDNVEDRMGPVRYLIFYLLCGVAAAMTHLYFNHNSIMPTVGASGAIAGVLGAYLLLYPGSRVITLIPIFIFPWIVEIPAVLYLGFWFFSQLANGWAPVASDTVQAQRGGGVAFWAHVGGFLAGVVLVVFFVRPQPRPRARRSAAYSGDEYFPW
jgi:membrane associated rhomboid family serine protease